MIVEFKGMTLTLNEAGEITQEFIPESVSPKEAMLLRLVAQQLAAGEELEIEGLVVTE